MIPRSALAALPSRFDLVVIGGGITGAGIFNEAARGPASILLVEQNDFASGASSGSSKLVHGGLRYLKSGQWRLTLESVRERNRLLRERAGLVERQPFMMPIYAGMKPGRVAMRAGLALYDAMSGQMTSRSLDIAETLAREPDIRREGLLGAVAYDDAQTDDARLTLRLILEVRGERTQALNYVAVAAINSKDGRVSSVDLEDRITGERRLIDAGLVINATGASSTRLRGAPAGAPTLRPQRGSHLLFPLSKFPVRRAVSWFHPRDHRPIFVYPWEGVALYGTTDLDHRGGDVSHPVVSADEAGYLFEGLDHQFPELRLGPDDAIACFAGVRPIVAGGKADPSAESRESARWTSPGWIGVTGGKLTTFRITARQVLREAAKQWPQLEPQAAAATRAKSDSRLDARYGREFTRWLATDADAAEHERIADTPYCWGELRWAARHESVVHLDDLLLRRTRCGLLLTRGAAEILDRVGDICRSELGWDPTWWLAERDRYRVCWQQFHAVPT